MKSRWFLKLMVIALIIALLPDLVVSAADGPTRQQPPARERSVAPLQHARTGRVVVNEPAEAVTPDDDTPGSAIELQCGWTAHGEIDVPGDVDYYYTDFFPGDMLGGFINANEYGSTLDPTLALFEPDGTTLISYVDDFDGYDPLVHHTDVLGGGSYYWEVAGFGGSTGWYDFTVDMRIYLTTKKNGTVDGISYRTGDVLVYNYCAGYWEMFLDASNLGMKQVEDIAVVPDVDGIMMSFRNNHNTAFGPVSANDVYDLWVYDVGWDTAAVGLFTLLDGSDVGLSGPRERVDGVMTTDLGTLGISVNGNGDVPGVGGFADEDIIELFSATLGEDSAGDWYMLFDTSDTGAGPIDVHGIYMNNYWLDIYNVTDKKTDFGWGKTSFGVCWPATLGWDTSCVYFVEAFHAPSYGMPANVNLRGLDFGTDAYPDGYFTLVAADGAQSATRGSK